MAFREIRYEAQDGILTVTLDRPARLNAVTSAMIDELIEAFDRADADDALACLEAHGWPGNVRELENVVERAVVLARGATVDVGDLPDSIAERSVMLERGTGGDAGEGSGGASAPDGYFRIRVGTSLAEVEQRLLEETLRLTKGNKSLAAKVLGIDPKTVFRKLKAGEAEDGPAAESGAE